MYSINKIEIHAADHCTQKCEHCSHAADISPKRFYNADDYAPALELLAKRHVHIQAIDILGGEPFLNSKLLELCQLARNYTDFVCVMSNMFWLGNAHAYFDVLEAVDRIVVTSYVPIIERLGGQELYDGLLRELQAAHPRLHIMSFTEVGKPVDTFARIDFHANALPVVNTDCNFRNCKQLLPSGAVLGCCSMRRFDNQYHDAFDLNSDAHTTDFIKWFYQPLYTSCSHCSIATRGVEPVVWALHA